MIHANKLWPDAISVELWPYALRHANDCFNMSPFPKETETPLETFSKTKVRPDFQQIHPFGCPAYALDGRIQSGQKARKWEVRARVAVYIGPSPQHARTVGLVLSLTTGLVSPQFHVKHDDTLSTLRSKSLPRSMWQQLAGLEPRKMVKRTSIEQSAIPVGENINVGPVIDQIVDQEDVLIDVFHDEPDDGVDIALPEPEDESDSESIGDDETESEPTNPHTTTRSGRASRFPSRFSDYIAIPAIVELNIYDNPFAFAASSDPDVLYIKEALTAIDSDKFVIAMQEEVQAHVRDKNWVIVHKSMVPKNRKILPAVWAFRRKRDIATRKVYKWKARLNVHGGKQVKGLDYWETYAPVASWPSVRLIMYIAVLNNWPTMQLDFVLAFPQALVETDFSCKYHRVSRYQVAIKSTA